MNWKKWLLIDIFAVFAAYSAWAMWQVGYLGIWQAGLTGPGAFQILFDLVIACLLICSWMIRDAAANGRNAWPYVILTLAAGSFGPLAYLIVGEFRRDGEPALA